MIQKHLTRKKRAKKKKAHEDYSELERLEKENRQQKQTIRSLLKKIKKLDKAFTFNYPDCSGEENYEEYDDKKCSKKDNKLDQKISSSTTLCSKCGKGKLVEVVVANRQFERCSLCDFRSRATKVNG